MINWAIQSNHNNALAETHQALTPDTPGTIGFEIEQLYFHGTCLGPTVEVEFKEEDKPPRRLLPEAFMHLQYPNHTQTIDHSGACRRILSKTNLFDVSLDVCFYKKDDSFNDSLSNKAQMAHVLEFITAPMKLDDTLDSALEYVSNSVTDLYTYCKNNHANKHIVLEEWMNIYNKKEYTKHHPMKLHHGFKSIRNPKESTRAIINVDTQEIAPLFAIHVNTSILLEQLYTPAMREAFPIFTSYPPLVAESNKMGLLDWPSTRPNPEFETWEQNLTQTIHDNAHAFVHTHVKSFDNTLSDYSLSRIEGYFRALHYSYCILAFQYSPDFIKMFSKHQYDLKYPKDFFLHGLPKIKFDDLFKNGLTTQERAALSALASDKTVLEECYRNLFSIMEHANIPSSSRIHLEIDDAVRSIDYYAYLFETFVRTATQEVTKTTQLRVYTLEKTLPTVTVDGEIVIVPVLEFRACEGNGCTLKQLETLLPEQANRAKAFAQKGFEQMPDITHKASIKNNGD